MGSRLIESNNSKEVNETMKEYLNNPFKTKDYASTSIFISAGLYYTYLHSKGDKYALKKAVSIAQLGIDCTDIAYPNETVQNDVLKSIISILRSIPS